MVGRSVNESNPKVFLGKQIISIKLNIFLVAFFLFKFSDIQIGKTIVGRLIIELFADVTPRTAENFRSLCTGERGKSISSGRALHYKGSFFHRVINGFMAQGGDITHGNGTGGESIYGKSFADENFTYSHDQAGTLSMANAGVNTNGSQFFLTFRETPHLDGRHVVFGRVINGLEVLKIMEMVATDSKDCPRTAIIVADCGQIGVAEPTSPFTVLVGNKTGVEGVNIGDAERSAPTPDRSVSVNNEKSNEDVDRKKDEQEIEEEQNLSEEMISEQTKGMTDAQRRLFLIRLKLNQSRKANKKEVELEYKRMSDPRYDQKRRSEEWREKKKGWKSEIESLGLKPEESFMLDTAEKAEALQQKAAKKEKNRATFGWEAFTADATYKAYKKRLQKLPHAPGDTTTGEIDPLDYGKVVAQVSKAALDLMSKEIEDRDKARDKYSRRRMEYDASNVDYINDTNAHFNKKIKRAFDKYTVEIRQNLERGTAI